jgi:predicted aspartyl protease
MVRVTGVSREMVSKSLRLVCGARHYKHPAPIIDKVEIGDLFGHRLPETLDALVDTGADRTVVPLGACAALNLQVAGYVDSFGYDGIMKKTPVYWVTIYAKGVTDISIKALGVGRDTILLGRDFLQQKIFIVDNKPSKWCLFQGTTWRSWWISILKLIDMNR